MFLQPNPKNFHVQYATINRHWSPRSEKFAGGDSLLTAIARGWEVGNTVVKEQHWHGGVRLVHLYHFKLRRGDREITMPVVENPYVTRMLYTEAFDVVTRTANDEATERAG